MKRLSRILAACGLVVVSMEGVSLLALGAIALRGGQLSTYFTALLPHPAVSRRLAEVPPWVFTLVPHHRPFGEEGQVRGTFEWHPLLSYYRPVLPDGTPRARPTFTPDELRVYVIGGSTVEGGGISAHLQEALQAALHDRYGVRVINEGVGGYISTQQLILLETKILPFGDPHYVVSVDGYNDWLVTVYNLVHNAKERAGVTEEIWPRAELSWFYYWFDEWQGRKALATIPGAFAQLAAVTAREVLPRTYTGWLLNHLRQWTRLVLLPKVGFPDPGISEWHTQFAQTPRLPRERAELQALNARMMAETCEARGGCRFFWALQPGLPYRGEAMTPEERDSYASRPATYWQSLEAYYQDLRDVVDEDAAFWSPRFLDLSRPASDVAGPFFGDTVHLTDAGAQRTAECLATAILADLNSPTTEPLQQTAATPRHRPRGDAEQP